MTNRVKFSPTGLRISTSGVDVEAATLSQILFRAEDRSIPVAMRIGAALPVALNSPAILSYGRAFSSVPLSIIYFSTVEPTEFTPLYVVSGISNSDDYAWPVSYNPSTGGSIALVTQRKVDEIRVSNALYGSSSGLTPFGGWISAVVFDYE